MGQGRITLPLTCPSYALKLGNPWPPRLSVSELGMHAPDALPPRPLLSLFPVRGSCHSDLLPNKSTVWYLVDGVTLCDSLVSGCEDALARKPFTMKSLVSYSNGRPYVQEYMGNIDWF